MTVLVYNELDQNKKLSKSTQHYVKILEYNSIPFSLVDYNDELIDRLGQASAFIFRLNFYDDNKRLGSALIDLIARYSSIPCYPTSEQIFSYDDKLKQKMLSDLHGIPLVKTDIFFDKKKALQFLSTASFPMVFKLKGGAGSMNVMLLKSRKKAERYVKLMFGEGIEPERSFLPGTLRREYFDPKREFHRLLGDFVRLLKGLDANPVYVREKNYFYAQKFLPDNDHDIRITIIGDKAFGFCRYNREGDFRASGSGKIDYNISDIPMECVLMSFDLAKKLGLVCVAVDFLRDGDDYRIVEFSYTFDSFAVAQCPGFWSESLEFQRKQHIPEYLHLLWLLRSTPYSDLRQPSIEGFYA